jgi:hypothetical protein
LTTLDFNHLLVVAIEMPIAWLNSGALSMGIDSTLAISALAEAMVAAKD